MTSPPAQSFGPSVYQSSDGELYAQVPGSVLKRLCPWLDALVRAFDHRTMTPITRAEFMDLLPDEARPKTKRTVTNWWAKFKAMGLIDRERDEKKPYLWIMTWKMPFLAGRPEKPADPVVDSRPNAKVEPAPISPPIDLEAGKWAVEFCEGKGWKVLIDGVDAKGAELLRLDRISGREQEELTDDFKVILRSKYREAVLVYLKRSLPARE